MCIIWGWNYYTQEEYIVLIEIHYNDKLSYNKIVNKDNGTIDQLAPSPPQSSRIPNATRPRNDAQIRAFMDYYADDAAPLNEYCELIDGSGETLFIRSFRRGGGRSPFQRGGGRGRERGGGGRGKHGQRGHGAGKSFKGNCNSCGMANHHAELCYFLLKLRWGNSWEEVVNCLIRK